MSRFMALPRISPVKIRLIQSQTILSVGMMFRYSFHLPHEADAIEQAVDAVLAEGWRTQDIAKPGEQTIGTVQMGELIRRKL